MNELLQLCSTLIEVTPESQWIHIFPAGTSMGYDGRGPYILRDADQASSVIQASMRSKVDLMIDRDHQKDLLPPGTPVPAAGWIKELQWREDGLHARVEWTESAQTQMKSKEFRYISPVFKVNPKTREVTQVLRASLTNLPNLELTAVASQEINQTSNTEEINSMDKSLLAIAALMALTNPANAEAIVTAAQERFTKLESLETELASIRTALGVDEKAETKTIVELATALKTKSTTTEEADPSKYVPLDKYNELATQVADLQAHRKQSDADDAVDQGMKDGKVPPAMKDWATAYAKKDLAGFNEYLKTAPVIVTAGQTQKKTAVENGGVLDADDIALCSQLGISQEEYKKQKAALEAA